MEGKYTFGRDTYIYNECEGVKITKYTPIAPPQEQNGVVGDEYKMIPRPIFDDPNYIGSNELKDKVIIVTGGNSGLGRAASIAYAKEGAKIVIVYYNEDYDILIVSKKKIVLNYISSYFLLDVASSIPFSLIAFCYNHLTPPEKTMDKKYQNIQAFGRLGKFYRVLK